MTRTARPSGNLFASVTRSIQGCDAEPRSPAERGRARRGSSRATRRARRESPRSARACCPTPRSAGARSASPRRTGRGRTPAASPRAPSSDDAQRAPGCRVFRGDACAPRRRKGASSIGPRHVCRYSSPNRTTSPAPRVRRRSPGRRVRSRQLNNSFLIRDIDHARVPGLAGGLGHELARSRPGSGFSREGRRPSRRRRPRRAERAPNSVGEVARPREEVRLEEGHEPAVGIDLARRGQRGRELRRMVRVVVDDEDARALPLQSRSGGRPR